MFKNPFSFEGRIRRKEFALTILGFYILALILGGIASLAPSASFIFILLLPYYWLMIAQGAKRCHDLGNSGWFQLIPFYGFWMLFVNGEAGTNAYGPNPKEENLTEMPIDMMT